MTRGDDGPHGLLLVDKPAGPTSHDVVRWVRKALRTRRVGHAGTLDPFATGLLACGIGRATRLLRWYSESAKTYEGVIQLGFATDSGDVTGQPLGEPMPCDVALADIPGRALEIARERLSGDLLQVPPMHSAKKIGGVPLHRLARRGESVEREPVAVTVSGWRLEPAGDSQLAFRVTCSAGTYVRVLAQDLGEMLGCGAHLASLRRVSSGALAVERALPSEELGERAAGHLIPIDDMPLPLPELRCVRPDAEISFLHGAPSLRLAWEGEPLEGTAACRGVSGALLGIAGLLAGEVRPDVVVAERAG